LFSCSNTCQLNNNNNVIDVGNESQRGSWCVEKNVFNETLQL